MKIINLTPHDVDICDDYGNIIKTYKASGQIARESQRAVVVDCIDGIPLKVSRSAHIVGLPEPEEGTLYIVSTVLRNACKDRLDLISPATKVRVNGRVVGCTSFMSNG